MIVLEFLRRQKKIKNQHITLKDIVTIMTDFLEHNIIELKNGQCKVLLDKLLESEKVFKNNFKMSESFHDDSPDHGLKSNPSQHQHVHSNPNVSITKEPSNNSLNTPQQNSRVQKSKFYQEDNDQMNFKDHSSKSLTKIGIEQEQLNKIKGITQSIKSSQTATTNIPSSNDANQLLNQYNNSYHSITSSPKISKLTPTSNLQRIDHRRGSFDGSPFQCLSKRRSISVYSYQVHIKKMYSSLRFIFTKVGFLLHYQKMQNYFFREEDVMKIRQHQKLRLFQHKRTTSLDPSQNDCTPLSIDGAQGGQSPTSTFSAIGVMSPFLNSPQSSNSSGINQKQSKDDQFNVTILYQKVNEDIDVNDLKYANMVLIINPLFAIIINKKGKTRKLENETCYLSKKAKKLFYSIKRQILDFEEVFQIKRSFLLHKFFIWKMKRWYTQYKRIKTENKKMTLFVNQYMEKQVCRICDQKVFLKHFKYHSQLCKEKEELKREMKTNMKEINTEMFYFLQKSRSLGVKCQLIQKKIDKIQKLQEQNLAKQLQVMRRKSFQNFSEELSNKQYIDQNGNLKMKNGSNKFKDYIQTQKSKNPSQEKLQDQKSSKPSLTMEQDQTFNKISEDDNDDSSNDQDSDLSSGESNTDTSKFQHSLSQFDNEAEMNNNKSRRNSGQSDKNNSSFSKKKQNSSDIQNKENQPTQQYNLQQDLQIQTNVSIDKQGSKNELQIINELTENEDELSKPFIASDKFIHKPLGLKSQTPKNSISIGKSKEVNSVSSIICTSDEEDKVYSKNFCPSTPNIEILEKNEPTKQILLSQLGLIVEENEGSKNPSKDEKHLTVNNIDHEPSLHTFAQETLSEITKNYEEENIKNIVVKIQNSSQSNSLESINPQIYPNEKQNSNSDSSSQLASDFIKPVISISNPQNEVILQVQNVKEEESNQLPSKQSLSVQTKSPYNNQDYQKMSSYISDQSFKSCLSHNELIEQFEQEQRYKEIEEDKIKQETQEFHSCASSDMGNQSGNDQTQSQGSPLPAIFEKEFKEINNQQYQQQAQKQFNSKGKLENSNSSIPSQYPIDSGILQNNSQDHDSTEFCNFQQQQSQFNENNNRQTGSKVSSQVSSPDIKNKKKITIKDDLQEKFSILEKSIKQTVILNEIESEFSSANTKNVNVSKDQNKSNNIRIQLNRLASLEVQNISSPYRINYQVNSSNSEEKFANSQNESKTSLKDEGSQKQTGNQKNDEGVNFSHFNPISQQSSTFSFNNNNENNNCISISNINNNNTSNNSSNSQSFTFDLNQKGNSNSKGNFLESSLTEKNNPQLVENKQTQAKLKNPSGIRQRLISNPNPSDLYQRENTSSSPSSASSITGDRKSINSISFTQFRDNMLSREKRKKQKAKQNLSPAKPKISPSLTPQSKDHKLIQDVVQLSNNFELKIKQHQLKSNHICLRIFEIVQQLSKMFFMQDFQNNWKRKRMMLDDNKQKIQFLCEKSMIPKDYTSKIQSILSTFTNRVVLLEKLQNVEKQLSKQFEDINEEFEKTDDNLSNESGQTKQSKQSSVHNNRPIQKSNLTKQQLYKSGTLISSKTLISKDSYVIESPTAQSDQQSQASNRNIKTSQTHSKTVESPKKLQGMHLLVPNSISQLTVTSKSSISPQASPLKREGFQDKIICNLQSASSAQENINKEQDSLSNLQQSSLHLKSSKQISSANENIILRPASLTNPYGNQSLLSNNKRRMSAQQNLTLEIKNTIFQKVNQELSIEKTLKKGFQFKEDENQLNSYQKFDQIMKQAMVKFENDLVEFEKPPKYHDGYFSDGNVENCYQCLETIEKKDSQHQTNISDFEFLKLISKGAFGRVWLVKKKNTNNVYAMKIVNLAEKMNKNNLMSLQNERDIFGIVSGDFVVKAVYTFSHESYLCFVMEYMIGGDLGGIMQQYGVLDETVAKFYIAEIILACSQLHKAGIVHRDLKPDNLLLDSQGHLKLTDFGLSDMGIKNRNMDTLKQKKHRQEFNNLKRGMDRISSIKGADKIFTSLTPLSKSDKTRELKQMKSNLDVILNKGTISKKMKNKQKKFRIIGTPDYIPPEVIKGCNNLNSPSIDWWSVGVILFEMLVGIPPFNDETVEQIFDNITNLRVPWDQINIGYGEDEVSPEAEDLIKQLMNPNPSSRLGINGVEEIQQHQFFKNFDWENVRKMSAPVIPKVNNILDTSNFDKQIQYTEKEKIDPFYGLSKGVDEVNKAKDMLKNYNFQMKRYDILYEENCQQLEEIQKKMKFMEDEIQKDEKELEKLEVEYGSDNEDSSDAQPFNIPKKSINANNNSSLYSYPLLMKDSGSDEQVYGSLKNIADINKNTSNSSSNKQLKEESQFNAVINQIQEDALEHIGSKTSFEQQ